MRSIPGRKIAVIFGLSAFRKHGLTILREGVNDRMCGTGNRTCGICANAGGCLASMKEDYFCLATKEEVKKRLEENKYRRDTEIMKKYVNMSDDALAMLFDWA